MTGEKNGEHILAWHFLADDRRLQYGERVLIEAGSVSEAIGRLKLCDNGLHASLKPLDALGFAPGAMIERVLLEGEILHGDDKLCARQRTCLWIGDATNLLHEYACWAAEYAFAIVEKAGGTIDQRSRAAVDAKRKWLRHEISDEELAAAEDAAWVATRDAAWVAAEAAARAAAEDAAWVAAREAAWVATEAAARVAAEDAAWFAARDELNTELEARLWQLAPAGYVEERIPAS